MSAIQSNVGLITGIPIQETVDQLLSIASRPRNLLSSRNEGLEAERAAIDRLSSLTLSTKFSLNKLNQSRTFGTRTASTDSEAVSARVKTGSTPAAGSYQFTPLKLATSHQVVSSRIDDLSSLGNGALSFRFGGHIDKGVALAELNAGEGVATGKIKITDRAGQTGVVDLRGARTIDDVLEAINTTSEIDVTASVQGDRLVLTDQSGESGTLRVREVDSGSTAASLGLLGSATTDTLTGTDLYGLSDQTSLASLNDGLGVRLTAGVKGKTADLTVTLADGTTTADIDLSSAKRLGDVVKAINDNEDLSGKLTVSINAAGNGLDVVDSSGGTGDLVIVDANESTAATDLGIATTAGETTFSGTRLISGLKDTLVSNLNAGAGIELGEIEVTDRAGTATTVDLSAAETLGEVVEAINESGAAITARINDARNGIVINDTSGGSGSLVIANGTAGTTADDLGIASDAAVATVDGGSLGRQAISKATRLEDFGSGVAIGDIKLTDSSGRTSTIQIQRTDDDAQTIGDVIDRINASAIGVDARINDKGDGILLTDTAGGDGVLKVAEVGNKTTAADLGLLGDATTTNEAGAQVIDGTTSYSVDLSGLSSSATATSLASLNGREGVNKGEPSLFRVTNSTGTTFTVDLGLAEADAKTIGDVIDRINEAGSSFGVTASLNENQSGIVLTDSAGGDEPLTVDDVGSSTTAADLNLIRTDADKSDTEIDGRGLFAFDGDNALQTLAERINQLEAGVKATVFNDGDGSRLSLTSNRPGAGNELLVDGLAAQLGFTETSRPSDAVALFGGVGGIGGFTVTSETNEFSEVIEGVTLTANQATGEATTVDLTANNQPVIDSVQGFVDAYNSLRSNLDQVTDFDAENATTGILFGRSEAVSVDTQLSRLLTDRYVIDGEATTLGNIGLSVNGEGKLELDAGRLRDALADNPEQVESLFRDKDRGVVAKLSEAIDRLAGDENALLSNRSEALSKTIEGNKSRIETLNESLERQRERLLLDFYRLEETVSLLQSNTSFLDSIVPVAIRSK